MTCYRQPFESARILVSDPGRVKRYRAVEPPEKTGEIRDTGDLSQAFGRSPPSGP